VDLLSVHAERDHHRVTHREHCVSNALARGRSLVYVHDMTASDPCWVIRLTLGATVWWSGGPADLGMNDLTQDRDDAYRFSSLFDARTMKEGLQLQHGALETITIETY
jgi:hypothetical protein